MTKAIVTGASSGLGRAIAKLLSIKGYEIIIVGRSMDKIKYGLLIILFGLSFNQDIPSFNAKRAMDLLITQCAFGPRYPDSPGHEKMKKFMELFLNPLSVQSTNCSSKAHNSGSTSGLYRR